MQSLEKDSSNKAAWSQQACALTPGMQGLIDVEKGKISSRYPGKKLWEQAHRKFSLACRKLVRATSSMTGPRDAVDQRGVLLHHVQAVLVQQVARVLVQVAVQAHHLQHKS